MPRRLLALVVSLSVLSGPAGAASLQTGFSPEGSAEALVLKVIGSAKHDLRMMGYSFTSPTISAALAKAARSGVDVKLVLDEHGNEGKASKNAMNYVVNAGVQLRTIDKYKIQHDKVIVVDGQTVETGSFNYTASAAKANSENVLVAWEVPDLAADYLRHWQSRWDQGTDYRSSY
ncbi:phospholipase D family protein [Pseudomonas sp. GM_Psu_2]|uniref:phospholipase D family nuclease n=1 Tax=Pseudomonas sp. GM_Psu_1 TaxID=2937387 RepID=UPI00226992AE|nr:phospholipase D family protein [Pseudomonas sp. GM_Psu_2]